jgi:epoxyqueuosine reductase
LATQITDVKEIVKRAAAEAGFELAGVAPATGAAELKCFPDWIAAGHAGEMKYMEARDEQGDLKRSSLSRVAPWARSVVVCAINYNTAHPYSTQVQDLSRGWVSRYAWSREDYHDAVLRRVKQVEATLRQAVPAELQADRRARLCQVRGRGMDRQEYLHHQPENWFVGVPRSDSHFTGT